LIIKVIKNGDYVEPRIYVLHLGTVCHQIDINTLLPAESCKCMFFHGSNDGQKGMGLIMLILIGAVPTAYALNRTATPSSPSPRSPAR
jgi:PiT family inorganic phosphate transporter